jgi:hypothetical protein
MPVEWYVEGVGFGNCSCDYSCPCQFEARPTFGGCSGIGVIRIDRGRFGPVRLDGLKAVTCYAWPGPIYEGNGAMQAIIDEAADPAQRSALRAILHGEETADAATHWWVFRTMSSVVHDTLYRPIEFQIDVDGRTARVDVPGLLESVGQPILSPVDGKEHRIRIDLPNGIEFEIAEIGRGFTRVGAALPLNLNDTYGQFNRFHLSQDGIVRQRDRAAGPRS